MYSPRFFTSLKDGAIRCGLCHRHCMPAPGTWGQCKVRYNRDGNPELPFYGFITGIAVDPIEKKPLYHFRPGTEILSVGFAGCNLHCPFCQNWHISQNIPAQSQIPGHFYSPKELVTIAKKAGKYAQIAYTYSEPLVHIEFLLDCMSESRKAGVANVLVSNGCIDLEAASEILELCDAANIDLKCFSEETYTKVLGGDLSTVKNFIRRAVEKGVHLELTTLVVPGLNDSEEELDNCRDFIAELEKQGTSIPWHLSAYHPDYKWKAPATDPSSLIAAAGRAKEKLSCVYTGNISEKGLNDTLCPCGKVLINRRGYRIDPSGLSLKNENGKSYYRCAYCGEKTPIRF